MLLLFDKAFPVAFLINQFRGGFKFVRVLRGTPAITVITPGSGSKKAPRYLTSKSGPVRPPPPQCRPHCPFTVRGLPRELKIRPRASLDLVRTKAASKPSFVFGLLYAPHFLKQERWVLNPTFGSRSVRNNSLLVLIHVWHLCSVS